MFRLVLLASLFVAAACASQEERSDVSVAGEPVADMAGAVDSAHESSGAALANAPESASDIVQRAGQVVAEATDAAPAAAPQVELSTDRAAKAVNKAQEQVDGLGALSGKTQP